MEDRIERTVFLRAPRERIWRALTTTEGLARWFAAEAQGDTAPGGIVTMRCGDQRFAVTVAESVPPERFSWRWHPGAHDPALDYAKEPQTTVTFTLTEAPGGTLLKVVETGFDAISLERRAKVFEENTAGWREQLEILERNVHEGA